MATKKTEDVFVTVGYQLTVQEAQALLDYLAERPFKEVFTLVGAVTAHPVHEIAKAE